MSELQSPLCFHRGVLDSRGNATFPKVDRSIYRAIQRSRNKMAVAWDKETLSNIYYPKPEHECWIIQSDDLDEEQCLEDWMKHGNLDMSVDSINIAYRDVVPRASHAPSFMVLWGPTIQHVSDEIVDTCILRQLESPLEYVKSHSGLYYTLSATVAPNVQG